jgi:hypothetical protein
MPLVSERRDLTFRANPVHFLMGIIDTMPDAEDAIAELLNRGITASEIHTWFGDEGVKAIDPNGQSHGLIARLWRGAQNATGEHHSFERYAEEIAEGHICLGVHCAPYRAPYVAAVLSEHGGHYLNYHGVTLVQHLKR